jgi:transcriptional regulator with XRE-family HTH domain
MVRRRQLGTTLRQHRLAAALTVSEVASRLLVAPSKISRIENAQRNASVRDVRDLCDIYGITDDSIRGQLMELARGSRERAWWQDPSLAPAVQKLIGIEGSARQIREFEALVVPGLLQTRAYAEAITPSRLFDDEAMRHGILDARMRRQQIFDQERPPDIDIILDESVLRRVVGGQAVMREQLGHLIKLAGTPCITLRVIPFAEGAHASMTGGFTILEFAPPDIPAVTQSMQSVAYVETLDGSIFHDQPEMLTQYSEAFTALSGQALSEDDSVQLMRAVGRSM